MKLTIKFPIRVQGKISLQKKRDEIENIPFQKPSFNNYQKVSWVRFF